MHHLLDNVSPLPTQRAFVDDAAPLLHLTGTVGSGKTFAGALKALDFMLNNDGARGLALAPNHETAHGLLAGHLRWMCQVNHLPCAYNPLTATLELDETRSSVTVASAYHFVSSGYRSMSFAFVWLDDATLMDALVEPMARARLRQPGYAHQCWVTALRPRRYHHERIAAVLAGEPFPEPRHHAFGL